MVEGLYAVRFRGAGGQKGGDDVLFKLPRPVRQKSPNPGRRPQPPSRLRWKVRSLGYFDPKSNRYEAIQAPRAVPPAVRGSEITYAQIFPGVDLRTTCTTTRLKEEFVLSQSARDALPSPATYGISADDAYLMLEVAFSLAPNTLRGFARRSGGKVPIQTTSGFAYQGPERIDFEDDTETVHFSRLPDKSSSPKAPPGPRPTAPPALPVGPVCCAFSPRTKAKTFCGTRLPNRSKRPTDGSFRSPASLCWRH